MSHESTQQEYEISDRLRQLATPRKNYAEGAENSHTSPAKDASQKSSKKLNSEELEKSVQRLTTANRKERALPDLVKRTTLSREEEEKSIKRLYDDTLNHREKKKEMLERKSQESLEKGRQDKKLDEQELGDTVSRLYEKSVMQHDVRMQSLVNKHTTHEEKKRFGKEKIDEVNSRLYNESCSKQQEAKAKLFEKYISEKEPKMAKRNKEQMAETASRLTQKGNN